jgi:hypothetical protein
MSSIAVVACSSVICLLFNDDVGGRYMFAMFMRLLFGSVIFANMQYSLLLVHVTVSLFRT